MTAQCVEIFCAPHDRMIILVSEAKFCSPEFRGLPEMRELNRSTYAVITRKWCKIGSVATIHQYEVACRRSIGTQIAEIGDFLEQPYGRHYALF